jgi:uncharacterized membrane protein (DUF441 family)
VKEAGSAFRKVLSRERGTGEMSPTIMLLGILILGIVGKSNIIAAAAGILLVIQFTNLQYLLPVLEKRGLELGLLFLVLAVLVPFASGRVPGQEVFRSFVSVSGIIAIISGALATHLNGHGLELLQREPYLMIGLVIGSIVGVIFFGGIPVGPLMAGGIAAILLSLANLMR